MGTGVGGGGEFLPVAIVSFGFFIRVNPCSSVVNSQPMKAVRLIKPGSPLELQNVPEPKIGFSDVLVRVKAAGICHSDAHYRKGVSKVEPLPLTLGHEVAGVVEDIGNEVLGF